MLQLIKAKGLIDGSGTAPIMEASVIIHDDTILYAGPSVKAPRLPNPCHTLDLSDKFVLPGLINTHVHLTFSASSHPLVDLLSEGDETLLLRAAMNARTLLQSGVTTIRDCGAPRRTIFHFQEGVKEGLTCAPRLCICGRPLTITGGHLYWCGEEADNPLELRKAVRKLAKEGVQAIKIVATGGRMTPGSHPEQASYSLEELESVVSEAHRFGFKVIAHCLATEGIKLAALAKVDCIEHCSFLIPDKQGGYERKYDRDVAKLVVDAGIVVTLGLSTGYHRFEQAKQKKLQAGSDETFKLGTFGVFAKMKKLGAKIVVGTDAGVALTGFDETHLELELMVRCGMSPMQALLSATRDAALAIGLEKEIGVLKEGKKADLIAVGHNPLDDIKTLQQIVFIMKNGEIIYEEKK